MRLTIRLKLVVALGAGLLLIAASTSILMKFVHERAISVAAARDVDAAATALDDLQRLEVDRMSALLEAIVANERFAAPFERRDRAALLAVTRPLFEKLRARHGITHWYFHLPDPRRDGVFLRVHQPELHGDSVKREVVARAVASGGEASGTELGRTAYAVRVVGPWVRGGRVIGYVELGEDVPTFLGRIKGVTGDDYGMLLAKERIDRGVWASLARGGDRWDDREELLPVESTTGDDALFGSLSRLADVPDAPAVLEQVEHDGRVVARGVFPLRGPGGEKVGGVVVLHDVTALREGVRDVRSRVLVLVSLLAASLGAFVVFLLESLVFERIQRMSRVLEELPARLARGETDVGEVAPHRDDEIGRFEEFLGRALRAVGSFVVDVRRDRRGASTRTVSRDEDPGGL